MKENTKIYLELEEVDHFESYGSIHDSANKKLKEGWVYINSRKEDERVYLVLGKMRPSSED
jgi:hypothetical protein